MSKSNNDIFNEWINKPLREIAAGIATEEGMGDTMRTGRVIERAWQLRLVEENARLIKKQTRITFCGALIAATVGALIAICGHMFIG